MIDDRILSKLLNILKTQARGKENAIHTKDLSAMMYPDPKHNDRRIRKACEVLRNERGERIVSNRVDGIFFATNVQDVKDYQASMKKEIAGAQRSITASDKIIRDMEAEEKGLLFPVGAKGRIYD